MELLQHRLESWMSEQRTRMMNVSWRMKWPPWINGDKKEKMKRIKEEYERRRKQLQLLCLTVKVDSISDLQEILACMVLSECVYKKPSAELVRAVNKYKADFGGEVVSLERVQPSSDHVPHRYLLAETGDTLFASFVGTKQYKDFMADANILQGAIFNEDAIVDSEEIGNEHDQSETRNGSVESQGKIMNANSKQLKKKPKPAVHRGFMARAKGIPALELYRLAQKKNRKLVLCGHSLGGAVAALATLAILRVIASSKENEKVLVKCITFSQPPVGNAALRDYVNRKGWQHYFKTYCIPEDLVPRILSPAYFHHYNAQPLSTVSNIGVPGLKANEEKAKENEGEQLVLGLGPVQNSFWRLSRLVPLDSVKKHLNKYQGTKFPLLKTSDEADSNVTSIHDDVASAPQSLEIQEGLDGISLKPITNADKGLEFVETTERISGKGNTNIGGSTSWRQVPYLPSYVPFGQLYILGNSSVESLSGAEYSKLTSVKSVIAELRERLQSHSMKSYRSRFQRIYDLCMGDYASSFLGLDQLQQFPHLQQWLGISMAGNVELGHIVESPVIRTATSIVPLGWSGNPGAKHGEPLKVDITGFGLHLCTLVQAQVNGNWCSTTVESIPSAPTYYSDPQQQLDLQKMRVLIGPPLKGPPKHQPMVDSPMSMFPSMDSLSVNTSREHNGGESLEGNFSCPEGLNDFVVYCTNDFTTVSKEVHVRTRKVRLIGLEGAGKTSLFKAIVSQHRISTTNFIEHLHPEGDNHEYISGGLCYSDSEGINLQELSVEISRFRDELWNGIRDLSRKTDLIVLVHNLSHVIPRCHNSNVSELQPALSLLLNEAKVLGIPWILAITNKFSVSAHQQKAAIDQVLQAYKASPSTTGVINSLPYVMPLAGSATMSLSSMGGDSDARIGAQRTFLAPIDLVWRPFQKKATTLPIEGVTSLCQLVHRELRGHEEASFQELAKERLLLEVERERATATAAGAFHESQAKETALSAAAIGASLGAGLGVVLAVVMGAASALRKP